MALLQLRITVVEHQDNMNTSSLDKEAWLKAEKTSWEPWLIKQKGFIGRQLLWDPNNEEAVLLISWATYSDWKKIPQTEIDRVQKLFEDVAMELTETSFINPFPIKAQGEFLPQ